MNKKPFPFAGNTGLVLGAAFLVTLTGCIGYVDGPRPERVYVAPAVRVEPAYVVEQDDYVYYPAYQMYYGSRSQHWYYQQGRSWVARPAPRGVSVDVIFGSPAVSVGFHDSPAMHHAEISRSYPKNWRPSGDNRGRNEDQHDNRREDKRNDHQR